MTTKLNQLNLSKAINCSLTQAKAIINTLVIYEKKIILINYLERQNGRLTTQQEIKINKILRAIKALLPNISFFIDSNLSGNCIKLTQEQTASLKKEGLYLPVDVTGCGMITADL